MPRNTEVRKTIIELQKTFRKTKKGIWKKIAEELKKPRRKKTAIGIGKICQMANRFKNKTIIAPGKILSNGEIDCAAKIAGISISEKAKQKLLEQKGTFTTINDLLKQNPKPAELIIIK